MQPTPDEAEHQDMPEPDRAPSRPRKLSITAASAMVAGAALLFGGVGFGIGYSSAQSDAEQEQADAAAADAARTDARLSDAYDSCAGKDAGNTVTLSDGGQTIVIDTRSKYGNLDGMVCVLDQLGTPESTIASIDRTTSMMGVQDDDQDGVSYSWSYHPDNGVNMVITLDD